MTVTPFGGDRPIIVGAGLAGLSAAIALSPRPCLLLLGDEAATGWAQGGIAAAVGLDDDAALHLADTLDAGAGLTDAEAARRILDAGPDAIARLARLGVPFDRDGSGALALGLEAAHGRRRIVHAHGDATGDAVLRALRDHVRTLPSVTVLEGWRVRRLLRDGAGRIAGVVARTAEGAVHVLRGGAVVLATGGLGALWARTTNPLGATGDGVALAAEAGARLAELEFVQFHPTAISCGRDPMPLASEAIRGEGAVLRDADGRRFMLDDPAAAGRAELAPRDVVARGVARALDRTGRVVLDATGALGAGFASKFPSVARLCAAAGIDAATMPIPVAPAAHYGMGGVVVDADGCTDVEGLFAVGETAATGLHGANRLASNSLLEAAVTGERVGRLLRDDDAAPMRRASGVSAAPPVGRIGPIRALMGAGFGVVRDADGMTRAAAGLRALRADPSVDALALRTALLVAASALGRDESRGAHARADRVAGAADGVRRILTLAAAERTLDALPDAAGRTEKRA